MAEVRLVRSAVCTRCGCACDDIDLTVSGGRIVEAENACALGRPWFLQPLREDGPPALVDGLEADPSEAAAAAARLLARARRPLVWGLLHLACEAQRLAVEIAERVRGVVDPAAGPNHPAAVAAFQEWGEVSATLGEAANQRGIAVVWFADPERTHPRLLERWRIQPGDGARLIRIGSNGARAGRPSPAAQTDIDDWSLPPERRIDLLWRLRELSRRHENGSGSQGAPSTKSPDVSPGDDLEALAERLLGRLAAAPHVVFAFDAAATPPTEQHALRALAAALNAVTRFRLFPLRGAGNRVGAEAVLTWQTGFPVAVDFASGAPSANGDETSAASLLERGVVDAALVVCASPADVSREPAFGRLSEVPLVLLESDPDRNPLAARAHVVLRSAPYGLASGGTFFRMDGVALGLRPALESRYPTEAVWLAKILEHLPTPNRGPSRGSEPGEPGAAEPTRRGAAR